MLSRAAPILIAQMEALVAKFTVQFSQSQECSASRFYLYYHFVILFVGARGSVVGWGTML
jgi:hypothetical protein